MKIDIITLFPRMLSGFLEESMLGRAQKNGLLRVTVHNLRDWGIGKHQITDDRPFGGGAGMLLRPEPLTEAIESLKKENSCVIYMAPDGQPLDQSLSRTVSQKDHLIIISGHYEGIDERIRETLIDIEISIGSYVLTNGTLPAAVLVDAVSRYIPGVLGEEKSLTQDSFTDNLLTFPQYTRPAEFRGMRVPEVLLSGDHAAIEDWRRDQKVKRTQLRRPDLAEK